MVDDNDPSGSSIQHRPWENDGSVTTAPDDGPYGRYGVPQEEEEEEEDDDSQELVQSSSSYPKETMEQDRNELETTISQSNSVAVEEPKPTRSTRVKFFEKVSRIRRSNLLARMGLNKKRLPDLDEGEEEDDERELIEGDLEAQQAADALAYELEFMGYDLDCDSFLTRGNSDISTGGKARRGERYAMPGGSSISSVSARDQQSRGSGFYGVEEERVDASTGRKTKKGSLQQGDEEDDIEKGEARDDEDSSSDESDDSDDEESDSDDDSSSGSSSSDESDGDGTRETEAKTANTSVKREAEKQSEKKPEDATEATSKTDQDEKKVTDKETSPEQDAPTVAETMTIVSDHQSQSGKKGKNEQDEATMADSESMAESSAVVGGIIKQSKDDQGFEAIAEEKAGQATKPPPETLDEKTPSSPVDTSPKKEEATPQQVAEAPSAALDTKPREEGSKEKESRENAPVLSPAVSMTSLSASAANALFSGSWQPDFQQFMPTTATQEKEVSAPTTIADGNGAENSTNATGASGGHDQTPGTTQKSPTAKEGDSAVPSSPQTKTTVDDRATKKKNRWGGLWRQKNSKNAAPEKASPTPPEEQAAEEDAKSLTDEAKSQKNQSLMNESMTTASKEEDESDDEEQASMEDRKGTPSTTNRGRLSSFANRLTLKQNLPNGSSSPSSLLEVVAVTGDEVELVLPHQARDHDDAELELPQRTRSPFRRLGKSPPSFSGRRSALASGDEEPDTSQPDDDDIVDSKANPSGEEPAEDPIPTSTSAELMTGLGDFISGLSPSSLQQQSETEARKPISLPERKTTPKSKTNNNASTDGIATVDAEIMGSGCKNPFRAPATGTKTASSNTKTKQPIRKRGLSKSPEPSFADDAESVETEEMDGGCRHPCDPYYFTQVCGYFQPMDSRNEGQGHHDKRRVDNDEDYSEDGSSLESMYESRVVSKSKRGRPSLGSRSARRGKSSRQTMANKTKKAPTKKNPRREPVGTKQVEAKGGVKKKKKISIREPKKEKQQKQTIQKTIPEEREIEESYPSSSKKGFFSKMKQRQSPKRKSAKKNISARSSKSSTTTNTVDLSQLENLTNPSEWAELNDAAHVIEHMMSNVGDQSNATMDDAELLLNTRKSTLGEVENALATLRKHANKLGVRESDLLLATTKTFDSNGM